MKKILVIAAFVTLLSAEDSLDLVSLDQKEEQLPVLAPSEELAKHEIDSFFEFDEDFAESAAQETSPEELGFSSSVGLPDLAPNESIKVKDQQIEINSQHPPIVEKSLETPSLNLSTNKETVLEAPLGDEEMVALGNEIDGIDQKIPSVMIDLNEVFSGSPTIYTILMLLSVASLSIWLYGLFNLRTKELIPEVAIKELRDNLINHQYDEALTLCGQNKTILFQMLASGIISRSHGQNVMLDTIKAEGRRASAPLWQKAALLNDIALIAPLLGLLGTVLGMFYAFYDLNRSMESITALFDGLGISVATTVCGLIVAILALIFHSIIKYRLVKQLILIENEAQSLANLIDTKEYS